MSNMYILIYIMLWFVLYKNERKKSCVFGPACISIFLYLLYAIISLVVYNDKQINLGELSLFPFLFLFFSIYVALQPGIQYERSNVEYIQKPNDLTIYLFLIVYGICALFSLINTLPNLGNSLMSLIYDRGYGTELYLTARATYQASDNAISGILGLFAIFHNMFKDFAIMVFFYYISLKNRSKSLIIYFSVVILSDLLSSLTQGGRTPFAMYFLTIIVGYFMFHNYWNDKTKRVMRLITILIGLISLIPFIALTISRFSSDKRGSLGMTLFYIGHASLYFDIYCFDSNGIRYGDRTANMFKRFLGLETTQDIFDTRIKYSAMNIDDSHFTTFVGDFVLDYGPLITLLAFIIVSIIVVKLTKSKNKTIFFHKLILVFFAINVCAQGGFYLFYYSFTRNIVIIAFAFAYIIFYIDYSAQKGQYSYIHINEKDLKIKHHYFKISTRKSIRR